MKKLSVVVLLIIGGASCGGDNTKSNVQAPGSEKDVKSKTLETGADLLQNKGPLKKNKCLSGWLSLLQRKHSGPNGSTSLCIAVK
jgi:hypothetical protein